MNEDTVNENDLSDSLRSNDSRNGNAVCSICRCNIENLRFIEQ